MIIHENYSFSLKLINALKKLDSGWSGTARFKGDVVDSS